MVHRTRRIDRYRSIKVHDSSTVTCNRSAADFDCSRGSCTSDITNCIFELCHVQRWSPSDSCMVRTCQVSQHMIAAVCIGMATASDAMNVCAISSCDADVVQSSSRAVFIQYVEPAGCNAKWAMQHCMLWHLASISQVQPLCICAQQPIWPACRPPCRLRAACATAAPGSRSGLHSRLACPAQPPGLLRLLCRSTAPGSHARSL